MPHENVETAQGVYDAFNRRDLDAFLAVFHPEVDYVSRLVSMVGTYQGLAGMRRWWNDVLGVFPDLEIEVVELRDLGTVTFASLRLHGHGRGSDAPVEDSTWQVARWRNGKVVSAHSYSTEAEALEAAELAE